MVTESIINSRSPLKANNFTVYLKRFVIVHPTISCFLNYFWRPQTCITFTCHYSC